MILACGSGAEASTESYTPLELEIQALNEKIAQNPDEPKFLFERANLFRNNGIFVEAITDATAAIKLDSVNLDYYYLLSELQLDFYQSKKALATMQKAVHLEPENLEALIKLGKIHFYLKQYDKSMEQIGKILQLKPQHAEAFFWLGMIFREQGDRARAINSFQQSVELEPDQVDPWIILGDLISMENESLAEQYYDNALDIDPNNITALHSKAFYLQNTTRIQEAIDLYQRIVDIDSTYADSYLNQGILFYELNELEKGKDQFNKLLTLDDKNPLAYYYLAQGYELARDENLAKEYYNKALEVAPDYKKAKDALKRLQ